MKKLLFFVLLAGVMTSCGKHDEVREQIIGKWRYDTQAIIEDAHARGYTDQKIQAVESAMALYQYLIFNFQEDGTLLLESPTASPISGTWELSSDTKSLSISLSEKGSPGALKEVSENRMVVEAGENSEMLFTRIFVPVEETQQQNPEGE